MPKTPVGGGVVAHAYAQARYAELTGWKAPAAGESTPEQLSPEQKRIDREARLTISRELGHEREQITAVYLAGEGALLASPRGLLVDTQ